LGFQGVQGFQGSLGPQGRQGFQGVAGSGVFLEVPTPVEVDADIKMPQGTVAGGTFKSIQGTFVATDPPNAGVLTATVTAGNYVLFWYAELARGSAGGGNRILARVRHTNPAGSTVTLANWRRITNIQNASAIIPLDDTPAQMATDGDTFTWSGFDRVVLAAGSHTFALQYAADAIGNSEGQDVLHNRRQKLLLLRVS
jgi:hypothetical protein